VKDVKDEHGEEGRVNSSKPAQEEGENASDESSFDDQEEDINSDDLVLRKLFGGGFYFKDSKGGKDHR
jgi:hypothetical protein